MRFQNGLNHLAGFIRCPQGGHILVYIGGAYKRGSSFCLSRVGGPKRWFCHVFFLVISVMIGKLKGDRVSGKGNERNNILIKDK